MSFLRNHPVFQRPAPAQVVESVAPLNAGQAEAFCVSQLMLTCSEFFELGCSLNQRKEVLTDEIIYDVAETALFSAVELARLLSPHDPQEFNLQPLRVQLFQATWKDLCARREEFLFKTETPQQAEYKKSEFEKVPSSDKLSLYTMFSTLYSSAYDFYSLAKDLSRHPDIFKNELANHVRLAYSQALSKMVLLKTVSHNFMDYDRRLQSFQEAEKKFNDNCVKYYLVEEASSSR